MPVPHIGLRRLLLDCALLYVLLPPPPPPHCTTTHLQPTTRGSACHTLPMACRRAPVGWLEGVWDLATLLVATDINVAFTLPAYLLTFPRFVCAPACCFALLPATLPAPFRRAPGGFGSYRYHRCRAACIPKRWVKRRHRRLPPPYCSTPDHYFRLRC